MFKGQKIMMTLNKFNGNYIVNEVEVTTLILQDTFLLETPGGGGYGASGTRASISNNNVQKFLERGSVYEYRMSQESV
ncbi:hypothetical protein PV327_010350 [Microctonus hyperodae]|uniref:Hydantoinase B/oxoprolinase domain-containing protein n=1 Tax=Microctonus hyperodae TaxID=165561 RepID=A0AA39FRQ3_MICHY|nr:hypothetical protein PV327_010350 [Microctonus hyperodae]